MPASKADIGLLALQSMKVVEGDATPETNDTTVIEAAYDSVYAMLNEKHLVSWPSSGNVPDELINPVTMLVAASRLTLFSPPLDVVQMIVTQAASAVEDITEMVVLDYVPDPIPSENF